MQDIIDRLDKINQATDSPELLDLLNKVALNSSDNTLRGHLRQILNNQRQGRPVIHQRPGCRALFRDLPRR